MDKMEFRILIVDDNVTIQKDFIKILKISKKSILIDELESQLFNTTISKDDQTFPEFTIDTATQGLEGIEKVRESLEEDKPYALAFVDIQMPPGMNGIETIRHIRKIDPEIQIVICSAYSDYTWEDTIAELGMSDSLLVLKKPFDVVAVRQLATALSQKWILTKDTRKHTESLNKLINERTESLQQSLSLLRATIESSSDGILVVDLDGKIIDFNKNFTKIWGLKEDILNTNFLELLDRSLQQKIYHPAYFHEKVEELKNTPEEDSKLVIKCVDDKTIECYSKPHQIHNKTAGRVWSFRDITEQIQLKEKMEYQATHDGLTGLPNRLLLINRIQHAIAHSSRYQTKFAILFFDLDRFKLVNDSISHEAGDELLHIVARRLNSKIRKVDTLARLGGDEFVMILPALNKNAEIVSLAQKILNALKEPIVLNDREFIISASIGISVYPIDGTSVNSLLSNADLAMYKAKEYGGNQFIFYTNQLNEQSNRQFEQETDLQHAIANNEFFVLYQPQIDVKSENIHSLEALARWNHPTKGVISPVDFIPIAENSGLIVPIGEWVLREVCRQIKVWESQGLPPVRVAVNVATKQLKQPDFAAMLDSILKEFEVAPNCIEIEVTENVFVSHTDVLQTILQLNKIGIPIVLDDFGTGNSSLNSLKQIHINRLKIDQSFVQNISKSRGDEVIIEAIIAISQSFNFKVVAEGVENTNQYDFLKKRDCDEVQGFLLSEPVSPDEIATLLKRGLKE